MTFLREKFPIFTLTVFAFLWAEIYAKTSSNQANFDFEKSLSSCEKPCFNGVCLNKSCICSKGWYGAQCDHCYGRTRLTENFNSILDGPQDYSSSAKCTWLIQPENNSLYPLTIKVNSFSTECGWDYLYIYDGDSIYGKQLAALCGDQPTQEFTALSGKALIYFFSDLAMNLDGFNISYESNSCAYNCSNHGYCRNGVCDCQEGFQGQFCERSVCEENGILNPCKEGRCTNGKCKCSSSTHGDFCQSPVHSSVWDIAYTNGLKPNGTASHASVLINNDIWSFGGENFDGDQNFHLVNIFNVTDKKWSNIETIGDEPTPRYDHTVVKYKNKLYMFGGVVKSKERTNYGQYITNELWFFDLDKKQWGLMKTDNESMIKPPFSVAGHTTHVVGSEMFVIFGYSPFFGFLHHIQIYNFETGQWRLANTSDHVYGRYKHSSVEYFDSKESVFFLVYGGSMWNNTISDGLMQFDVAAKKWSNLPPSGIPLYLHAAVLMNGLMLITGGRGAINPNNVSGSKTDCFSNVILSYDIVCKQWSNISTAPEELKRYGHTAHLLNEKLYIFGGFNGKMLNDVWSMAPAKCSSITKPDECRAIRDGTKCIFIENTCEPFNPDVSYKPEFASVIKFSNYKKLDDCIDSPSRLVLKTCEEQADCVSCASKSGCGWCSSGEQCLPSHYECVDGPGLLSSWEKCPQKSNAAKFRPCNMEKSCGICRFSNHCTWYPIDKASPCVSKEDLIAVVYEYETKSVLQDKNKFASPSHFPSFSRTLFRNSSDCPLPCAKRSNCSECVESDQCMWCPSTRRCINLEAYTLSFAYGQCHGWITSGSGIILNRICQAESSICEEHKTCGECQRDPGCGWLADNSKTGLGTCTQGSASGPLSQTFLSYTWHFVDCPACQCNGHSTCVTSVGSFPPVTVEKCKSCMNDTTGNHCERCAPGYYGDSRNGGLCSRCECNKQTDMCDPQTGQCYCRTKGVIGDHCEKCETKYIGNPRNGTPCYYELAVDFIFTFKLRNDDKDNHTSEIYLYSIPYKKDTDVTFQISCESSKGNALVSLNMTSSYIDGLPEHTQTMMVDTVCDSKGFRRVYVASEKGYPFGPDSNTTFFVRVYNFTTPVQIVVSFAQSPPINWVLFFVIFAACFIVLLVVAGLLWMVKVRIEAYRRNQRRIDEIEHMASRPFASTKMELSKLSQLSSAGGPTPLSIEPCNNYRTGVFTLAVRLPTGGCAVTPSGTSGLAVASSLCLLTAQQIGVLQAQENGDKNNGRKRNFCNLLRLPIRQRVNRGTQ